MASFRQGVRVARPQADVVPAILSATSYPQQRPTRRPKASVLSADRQLGYFPDDNEEDEDQEKSPRPNKKAKSTGSKDSSSQKSAFDPSGKKQRGRPRLEPRDETAADRRRTQIRLAQRAYRNRKENTISALKDRVTDLQQTIEQMHKSFSLLHDNVFDSMNLSAVSNFPFSDQLKKTMEEFEQLHRSAVADWDQNEETDGIPRLKQDRASPGSSRNSDEDHESEMQFQMSLAEEPAVDSIDVDSTAMVPSNSFDSSVEVGPSQIAQLESTLASAVQAGIWNSSIERPITEEPYTYSFQETTFARRLHRQCLERSFRFLSNPDLDPTFAARTFRFTFTFSNRKRILARLQELLKRKAGESLENWAVPFFPIGGAGTHFPRRDNKGNPVYPPNMLNPSTAFGPHLNLDAETPRTEETTEKVLEAIGFDGEWFDSHDVEEYLKTKGIYLDAQSSFVSVDAALVTDATNSSNMSLGSTPAQQLVVDGSSLAITQGMGDEYDQSSFLEQYDGSNASSGWAWNMAEPGAFLSSGGFGSGYALSPNTLTFDVEKFLSRVTEKGACLGRAPGFRRADVEAALQVALQDSF